MKKCLGIIIVLLFIAVITATGCNNPPATPEPSPAPSLSPAPVQVPTPVTNYASLVDNLRYAGAVIEVKQEDRDAPSYAEQHLNAYKSFYDDVQNIDGRIIEPVFLKNEMSRLEAIEEQTRNFEITSVLLLVNGYHVHVNEYGSPSNAEYDMGYVNKAFPLHISAPTDKGEFGMDIVASRAPGRAHYYREGRIIVTYFEQSYTDPDMSEGSKALSLLLHSLLPEFYIPETTWRKDK